MQTGDVCGALRKPPVGIQTLRNIIAQQYDSIALQDMGAGFSKTNRNVLEFEGKAL